MIWITVALAGTPPCEKMSEAEIKEISEWLELKVAPMREGKHPRQGDVNHTENLWAAQRLCTPTDKYHAATLMAYGFSRGSTRAAYSLAKEAMAEGVQAAPILVANIYDRYSVVRAKPQRYATMVGAHQGRPCLFPLVPADDTERALYDLGPLTQRYLEFSKSSGYPPLSTYTELGQHQAICPPRGKGKKLRTQ